MATWYELNADVQALGTTFDLVRYEYLRQLADGTGRTMVLLYPGWLDPGWLDRPDRPGTSALATGQRWG